jgi:glucose uptake protein
MGLIYAVLTVLTWGTWLIPSQRIPFRSLHVRTFYVGLASLALSFLVVVVRGNLAVALQNFWPPFLGGLIWAVSGYCAFTAIEKIGLARAVGIWTPLNIIVGVLWGLILFGEFAGSDLKTLLLLLGSLILVIAGILIIIFARGTVKQAPLGKSFLAGLTAAIGAGILWGSYFVPIKLSQQSMWEATFPLAIGILAGAVILMLAVRVSPRLDRPRDYLLTCLSGILWGIGNYGMLLLTETIGTGKGFTIAQLGVIVNVAFGIFLFKDPPPRSRAATITFMGVLLALLGAIILGNL